MSKRSTFFSDIIEGLSKHPKELPSKYFYDERGDYLFRKIMLTPEYYPTRCEMEILQNQASVMARHLRNDFSFDLVELGPGDASKSIHLVRELHKTRANFRYVPIDISENVISDLEARFPITLPELNIHGLNGEYLPMLQSLKDDPKAILFLGANIGNMSRDAAIALCGKIRKTIGEGDQMIIGFDLKKDPATILKAYNDATGYTREFNLNLLRRINRELEANFVTEWFEHYPSYDPLTGACKSFLVSQRKQEVMIGPHCITFEKDEVIFTEISQKYSIPEIDDIASNSGFAPVDYFFDKQKWFVDTLWRAV